MRKNQKNDLRRSMETIARVLDEIAPEDRAEAEEELRALGLDPSTVGDKLEQLAFKSIRARFLRDVVRGRVPAQAGIDLTNKLN